MNYIINIFQVSIKLESMQETGFKIFLGSLPPHLTNEQITSLLKKYGKITKAHLLFHKRTGFCKGFGHIIVGDQATYQRILQANLVIDGRKIFKEPFLEGKKLSAKKEKFVSKRIFVSNLPYEITDEQLKRTFTKFGAVEQAYRIISTNGKRQPYGFVLFENPDVANLCHKKGLVMFNGHQIKCRLFVNFEEKRKKLNQKKRHSPENSNSNPMPVKKHKTKKNKKTKKSKKNRNNPQRSQQYENSETSPTVQNPSQPSLLQQPFQETQHQAARYANHGLEAGAQFDQDRHHNQDYYHQRQPQSTPHRQNTFGRGRPDHQRQHDHQFNQQGQQSQYLLPYTYISQEPAQMIHESSEPIRHEAIFKNSKLCPWMNTLTLQGVSRNHAHHNIRFNPLDEHASAGLQKTFKNISFSQFGNNYDFSSVRRR